MIFDPVYFYFLGPAMVLALIAQVMTKSAFNKYSKVGSRKGFTGAQAARQLLDSNGLHEVTIERVDGFLSDHYDPRARCLRLSPGVHDSPSLAAIGVACHEAGHALQHAKNYAPLHIRSALVPMASFGGNLAWPIAIVGLIFSFPMLLNAGILLFCGVVAFTLITLPVEWDASARAKRLMVSSGIVTEQEAPAAGRVLNAAFLTYLAAAVTAAMQLLYLLTRR